jgi:hypothetical protein
MLVIWLPTSTRGQVVEDDPYLNSVLKCGKIYDGITQAKDVGRQRAEYPITANWEGFEHPDEPDTQIKYQFAIISQEVLTQTIVDTSYYATPAKRCRDNDGLEGFKPDVVGWTTLIFKGERETVDAAGALRVNDLDLKYGYRYYVILKAQLNDEIIYTNTDGVYITKRTGYDDEGDDDESDLPGWAIGLIAAACSLCCLIILLLILIAIAKVVRKDDDKYAQNIPRNANPEKI